MNVTDSFTLGRAYGTSTSDSYEVQVNFASSVKPNSYSIEDQPSWAKEPYEMYFTSESAPPDISLGGSRSGAPLSGADVGLFDTARGYQNTSGAARYRCVMLYGRSGLSDPRLWFTRPSGIELYFTVGLDSSPIPNEDMEPVSASISPTWLSAEDYPSYVSGYHLSMTGNGEAKALWLRLYSTGTVHDDQQFTVNFGGYY